MSQREKKKKRRRAPSTTAPPARTGEPGLLWAWRISAALGAAFISVALFAPRLTQTTSLYLRVAGAALFVTALIFFRTRK